MNDTVARNNSELRNRKVFNHRKLIWGIPQQPFVASAILTVFGVVVLFAYLPWYIASFAGLLWALMLMIPVYLVHQNDPDAYIVWLRLLVKPSAYVTHRQVRRRIVVLSETSSGMHVKPLSRENNP